MSKKIYSNIELKAKPILDEHLVNLGTVKNLISRRIKETVRLVDLEGIPNASYDPLTKELTGNVTSIDGVDLVENDRVLLASNIDASSNGIYDVVSIVGGTPSSATGSTTSATITKVTVDKAIFEAKTGANTDKSYVFTYDGTTDMTWKDDTTTSVTLADYGISIEGTETDADTITINYTAEVLALTTFKRSSDFDESSDITPNVLVPVAQGVNADKLFMLVNDGAITLDTDSLVFARYSSSDNATEKIIATFKGDGIKTEFSVQHGLNTKEIEVGFYDELGISCYFNYELTSENVITIKPDVLLKAEDGEFKVIIIG